LPLNEDGSLSFYWIDAHEENHGTDLYLFGKIYQPEVKSFVSCALRVNGMERNLFFLPKIRKGLDGRKACNDIYTELKEKILPKFTTITNYKCKVVDRMYAFELPLAHGMH
jgi:DNA polymerase alpha subunit A